LQGLQVVQVFCVGIPGWVDGVGGSMAGHAHEAGIVRAPAIELIGGFRPGGVFHLVGSMDGLKKPSQKLFVSSQTPGVSMKSMMPLMKNRESQAKMK